MAAVLVFGAYLFYLTFLTPSRTGNYLKIRKPKRCTEPAYTILPTYRFILRRIAVYFAVAAVFYLILPLYFSVPLSLALLFGGEWWRKRRDGTNIPFVYEWTESGYRARTLFIVIAAFVLALTLLHFAVYPLFLKLIA